MKKIHNISVRLAKRQNVDAVVGWAQKLGWNPGLNDAELFYVDPEGFFLAELDGEVIGSCVAVKYSDSYGFVGMYIINEECRGNGFGLRLFKSGMQYLRGVENVELDAVEDRVKDYEVWGFKPVYSHRRFEGQLDDSMILPTANKSDENLTVVELATVPIDKLAAYDASIFPVDRRVTLKKWISQPNGAAVGLMSAVRGLLGYGAIRPSQKGYRIGPLFADSGEYALDILRALISRIPHGSTFCLDVPDCNAMAMSLVEKCNFRNFFTCVRMSRGQSQVEAVKKAQRVFAVTSLEIG